MIRAIKNSLALSLLAAILIPISGCNTDFTNLNNPFNPRAELRILDITGSGNEANANGFIGIRQSVGQENGTSFIQYAFIDPVATLEILPGFPTANFTGFRSQITLSDGTTLPVKDYSLSKGIPQDATQIDIQFPIISQDNNIRETVYVGNNAPRVSAASAEVELFGKDVNGHELVIPFTVPLSFQSLAFPISNTIPELAPSASPAPTTPNDNNQGQN